MEIYSMVVEDDSERSNVVMRLKPEKVFDLVGYWYWSMVERL